jgi:hypothetical protein
MQGRYVSRAGRQPVLTVQQGRQTSRPGRRAWLAFQMAGRPAVTASQHGLQVSNA